MKPEEVPPLARVVVAIDPAVSKLEDSADTGIVAAGKDFQDPPHFYVLEDATCHESPDAWAKRARGVYTRHRADRVVGEVNNGGDLVEANIRHCDPNIPFKAVHASRGKLVRAEPIAALYEQGRVHHVGSFPVLEDQMCDYVPGAKSPDNMDAAVWALTELSDVEEHEVEVVLTDGTTAIDSELDEYEARLEFGSY
jgi:phage terminase large subunit-like protein